MIPNTDLPPSPSAEAKQGASAGCAPTAGSAAEDAARKYKICICGKPMNEGLRPQDEGGPVCWDCFKYRTDVTPYKYFQGSYDEWVMGLPNVQEHPTKEAK